MSVSKKTLKNTTAAAKPATKSTKTAAPAPSKTVTAMKFNSARPVSFN